MHLNPYGEDPVRFAVDLAAAPPRTAGELTARCVEAGVVVERAGTDRDVAEVAVFLERWLAVVDSGDHRERAGLLNALLAESASSPRLTDHSGNGWHLHYREPDLSLAGVLRALISVGTALHLAGRGMDRLHRCALADCHRPFADFSRGGRQRYCSPACANRDAVRRHRARTTSPVRSAT
ncbi:CGNR zinc finger domain-containing protein [Actinophytocola gossypii]|uniref:CGNR zinc finger domain-containing protein n=1 Tax=Actinophytocola gossypii TaxID=2812003 RepID=A0ABT2J6C4_9PSEU|nr:CGNR zinc finger domain-containing protein [Actinophytocola gossypii]MCT2583338.1 CGNR zinc finger domain-containing protein [Actinophytocola gossypii]